MPSVTDPGNAPDLSKPFTSAPTSSIQIGTYTPDWASLIANDPGLLATEKSLGAQSASNLAARNAQIQNAYATFGDTGINLSDLAKSLGLSTADVQSVIDPTTQALANQNTAAGTSTEARLAQANTNAIRQIKNSLNARGLLNSGETAYQLNNQQQSYANAQMDARQKLLSYLQQYQAGYLAAQQQGAGTLAQATSDAASRQFAANSGSAGFTALFDHVDPNGVAVYRGPDGSLYTADGQPYIYTAPASTTTTGTGTPTPTPTPQPHVASPVPVVAPPVQFVGTPSHGTPVVTTPVQTLAPTPTQIVAPPAPKKNGQFVAF